MFIIITQYQSQKLLHMEYAVILSSLHYVLKNQRVPEQSMKANVSAALVHAHHDPSARSIGGKFHAGHRQAKSSWIDQHIYLDRYFLSAQAGTSVIPTAQSIK